MFRSPSVLLIAGVCCLAGYACTPNTSAENEQSDLPEVLYEWMSNPMGARLPDYSYAGYRRGEELPSPAQEMLVFKVTDYGAIPNDGKDDIDAIQRAVDAAAQAGGGVVLLPQGTFDFDVKSQERFVWVKSSNIIIRGWGDGPEGTILHDHTASDYPDKSKKWLAGKHPSFFYFGATHPDSSYFAADSEANKITAVLPANRFEMSVYVDDTSKVETGKTYWLSLESEDSSLVLDLIAPLERFGQNYQDNEGQAKYKFGQWVTVLNKRANRIFIDNPILWDLKAEWKPTLWACPVMLEECGVEWLRMKTDWYDEFIHHKDPVHDNGWDHIRFDHIHNGWVRGITHENPSTAAGFKGCKNNVVYDCRIIGNRGHNGWVIGNSSRMLLFNLQGGAQMHAYSVSNRSAGNVFHRCYSEEGAGLDLHGGLSVYTLFDEMEGGTVRSGGSTNATPPHHSRGLTLWNYNVGLIHPYNYRIINEVLNSGVYPGAIMVGLKGQKNQELYIKMPDNESIKKDTVTPWGTVASLGKLVNPRSLYRFQHLKRTGYEFAVPAGKQ